jgi:hypothetical protein
MAARSAAKAHINRMKKGQEASKKAGGVTPGSFGA